jgi:hypothetical protein
MEYSIKKLPLKALKWAQFAASSHAHLAFTISFISYQDWTTYIRLYHSPTYSYSNLVPFSTHDVFLSITNLLHFFHTYIKLNLTLFSLCVSHQFLTIPLIISQTIYHYSQLCQTNYPYPSQHMVNLCHHKCLTPKGASPQMEIILLFIQNHFTVFLLPSPSLPTFSQPHL